MAPGSRLVQIYKDSCGSDVSVCVCRGGVTSRELRWSSCSDSFLVKVTAQTQMNNSGRIS